MTRPCAILGTAAVLCCLAIPAQATPITGPGYNGDLFMDGWLDEADGVIYNSAYYTGADPRNLAWLIYEAVPEIDDQVLVAFEDPTETIDVHNDVVVAIPNAEPVDTSDTNAVAGTNAIGGAGTASGLDADAGAGSSGPTLTEASIGAIAGLDVVDGIDAGGGGSAGAAVIDEPASLLTLGFGLTALVVAMRRQRRAV